MHPTETDSEGCQRRQHDSLSDHRYYATSLLKQTSSVLANENVAASLGKSWVFRRACIGPPFVCHRITATLEERSLSWLDKLLLQPRIKLEISGFVEL